MNPATLKKISAVAMTVLGASLLLFAHPLANAVPRAYPIPMLAALGDIALWIFFIIGVYAYARRVGVPEKTRLFIALALLFFALMLFPQRENEFMVATAQILSLAGVGFMLAGLLRWRGSHPCFARVDALLRCTDRIPSWLLVWLAYVAFLLLTVGLSWYCFSFIPGYDDSIAQYVHGKILAEGKFYESHPLQEFFRVNLMINTRAKWYSIWQPLHAFMLSLGFRVGAPWLVNPTEGALTLVAIYALARRACGESAARLAALLVLCCPMIVFMSSEYMNHATSLLFSALFLWCYAEMLEAFDRGGNMAWRWAFAAGLSLGLVFLIRPLTSVGIGLAYALYSLTLLWRTPRAWLPLFATMAGGIAICLLVQGWYDFNTTGKFWLLPYAKYHGYGIPGFNQHYTIDKALFKAQDEWSYMNLVLFEGFVPGTVFVMLACLLPLCNRHLRLLLAMLFAYTLVNMFNHFAYHIFGPRFIYETSPALIILTAAGITRLPALLQSWRVTLPEMPAVRGIVAVLVVMIFATGWVYRLPGALHMYSNHYFNNDPEFYESMLQQSEKPALIFIGLNPKSRHPKKDEDRGRRYLKVAFTDPPTDDAPVIFARDLGKKNRELIEYYPNRIPYLERDGQLYLIDTPLP